MTKLNPEQHEIKNETSTFEHPVRHAPYTGSDLSRRSLTRNPNLREGLMNSSGGLGDYYFNGTAAGAANTSGAADGISNLWPQSVRTEFKFLELLQVSHTKWVFFFFFKEKNISFLKGFSFSSVIYVIKWQVFRSTKCKEQSFS